MASQLTPGIWAIFKSRGYDDQPIWLGKTITNPEWGNTCMKNNNMTGIKNMARAKVVQGGDAINVQWYTQKVTGKLGYVVCDGDDATLLEQSNNDLILTGFDDRMHQVYGSRTRVPMRHTV